MNESSASIKLVTEEEASQARVTEGVAPAWEPLAPTPMTEPPLWPLHVVAVLMSVPAVWAVWSTAKLDAATLIGAAKGPLFLLVITILEFVGRARARARFHGRSSERKPPRATSNESKWT